MAEISKGYYTFRVKYVTYTNELAVTYFENKYVVDEGSMERTITYIKNYLESVAKDITSIVYKKVNPPVWGV